MAISYVDIRLYNLAGSSFTLLPDFIDLNFDVKYGDLGALNLRYPLDKAILAGLTDNAYLGVVLGYDDGTFSEVERYVVNSTADDKVVDGMPVRTIGARSSQVFLEDAVVYPSNWPTTAPSGHQFVNSSPGTIMQTLVARAVARGTLSNLTASTFTNATDSNGSAWATVLNQTFPTGTGYRALLQDWVDRGLVDMKLVGWDLRIYNGTTTGAHIPIGTLEIRAAKNVKDFNVTTESTESASTVLIEGTEGTSLERHNASAVTLLGRRREKFVSQGGTQDSGTLTILADAELTIAAQIPTEETVGVVQTPGLTPFKDYAPADWVWLRSDGNAAPVERRVRQLAVGVNQNRDVAVGLTLNSIIFENQIRLQRKIDGYSGQITTSSAAPQPGTDLTTPNPPTGLVVSSAAFVSSTIVGQYSAAVSATWTTPTTNTDSSPLTDLEGYEIQWRYTGDASYSFAMPSSDAVHQWSPVTPGRQIQVQVRTYDTSGHRSAWAPVSPVLHSVALDTTAPAQPTVPVCTSKFQSIEVKWDGLATSGSMDFDVARVEVWRSAVSGFTPQDASSTLVNSIPRGGGVTTVFGPYGTVIFIKLVAVDFAGNRSIASAQGSAAPGQIINTDISGTTIISDGLAPTATPASVEVIGGVGALFARWPGIVNHDPVTYEVHVSTTTGFAPGVGTLLTTTAATSFTIKKLPGVIPTPPAADTTALMYGTTYYVKIRATDVDGAGPYSTQGFATMMQVTGPDIAPASITTPKITVGSITGDLFAAQIALVSTIRTGTTGQRWEGDNLGIRLIGQNEQTLINLPTGVGESALISGNADLDTATIHNGLTLEGVGNEIATGGGVVLSSGIVKPQGPPVRTVEWESIQLDLTTARAPVSGPNLFGTLTPNADNFAFCWLEGTTTLWVVEQGLPNGPYDGSRIWQYNLTTGLHSACYDWGQTVTSLVKIGTTYYVMWTQTKSFFYITTNTTAPQDLSAWLGRVVSLSSVRYSVIGAKASTLVVAGVNASDNRMNIRTFTMPGSQGDVTITSTIATDPNFRTWGGYSFSNVLLYGSFDYGSPRYILGTALASTELWNVSDVAVALYLDDDMFPSPTGGRRGTIWDGTRFWSLGAGGKLYKHTTINWTTESNNWWLADTWNDSVGTTHETDLGAIGLTVMKKRARLRVSVPKLAGPAVPGVDDPDGWRLYWWRTANQPASTLMKLQATLTTPTLTYFIDTFPSLVGAAPPVSNNFPSATPGYLRSATLGPDGSPFFEAKGDGSGRWLIENWHLVGDATTGLGTVFTNGWTNAGVASWPPMQFAKDRFGYVHLWGRITHTGAVVTSPFTLPVGYRPPFAWPLMVRNSNSSGAATGMNINLDGTISCLGAGASDLFFGMSFATY